MVKTLKVLLEEKSLSLTKLAKLAGYRPATVMAIKNRSSDPKLKTVLNLCIQIPCSLRTFASCLGHDVSKIPLDCEVDGIVGLAEFAKARKTSLKEALKLLGIDVTGIPNDD